MTKGYGLTVHDIDWSCPADLEPYAKAHKLELTENDNIIHVACGSYVLSAISVAVEHCLAGKKARSKYIEKPILQKIEAKEYEKKQDRPEYKGMSDEEKQKAELEKAKDYFNSLIARF